MEFSSLNAYINWGRAHFVPGPHALIFAEDDTELTATIDHHRRLGFANITVFGNRADIPPPLGDCHFVQSDFRTQTDVTGVVNAVQRIAPGHWFYYGYNAEFLFYPFCETRCVQELATYLQEESRNSTTTCVVDVYVGDLNANPTGVNRADSFFDRSGYYSLALFDEADELIDRRQHFYGGLKRRFEEHVPPENRRIDRVAFFKSTPGLTLNPDFTFNMAEYNTISGPWHNSLTAAVASFRTAKALKRNPGSTFDIHTFKWPQSRKFDWGSQQLMDCGLMEPGQWF